MKKNYALLFRGIFSILITTFTLCALLFFSAGTWKYPSAWITIAIIILPSVFLGIFLFFKNPTFLAGRLEHREQQKIQKRITALGAGVLACGLIAAGIDFRLKISSFPSWFPFFSIPLFLLSFLVYYLAFRENKTLFRTVKVLPNQELITSGIYRFIRHPMYLASTLFCVGIVIVLNSILAFLLFFGMIPLLCFRVKHEEAFLEIHLKGYLEYTKTVKYRIIPFVW